MFHSPGAVLEEGAVEVGECTVTQPTVVVLGSEGFGLRTNTRRACTATVSIAAGSPAITGAEQTAQLVDSLNVSVATGILLHDLIRRRHAGNANAGSPTL
jgi:21S rRNA (GM2251-2'-O)-methyltransferase